MRTNPKPPATTHVHTYRAASVTRVPSPEDIADATMRRLRAEIIKKYGNVKNFIPELDGLIGYEGLNDNLAGRSDMKLGVMYTVLDKLGLDQVEFARRVMQDATDPRP